jgi:Gram-negative porin
MKRLTLLLLGLVLGVSATARAQGLTMQMSNGWSFQFAGNVNAFWVFTAQNNSGPKNSSVRTGLLPAFATFEARGKEAGLNLAVHFGFAPQIQNAGVHDNFGNGTQAGAQIDMRQVYLTVGGDWGNILAGRELSLFSRQNILQDMTLFGVGAVGIGAANTQGGGTTLGRIGYGYLYPNFNAQLTYSTKAGTPGQLSIGLFQPSVLSGSAYAFTTIPRLEAEFTYNQKTGRNKWLFWAGGTWQTTKNAPTGGNSVSSIGGTAGVRGDFSDLSVVVNGYIGKGLGTILQFSGIAGGGVAANGTDLRKSDGGYAQVTYKVAPKTTVGFSWGFSRLVNDQTGDGNTAVRLNLYSYTLGIYHQWTKSLKLVFEGTEEGNTGTGRPKQTDVSGGFMLFF